MKHAVSMTLAEDNVLWLKGQAAASSSGSVSEVVDRLVLEARTQGRTSAIRSVVGSIDLPAGDHDLVGADAYVRLLFDRSLARPMAVKERPPAKKRGRRG